MAVEHPHCLMSEMKAQWDEIFGVVHREANVGESAIAPQSKQRKGAVRTGKKGAHSNAPDRTVSSIGRSLSNELSHLLSEKKRKLFESFVNLAK
jgi:hypothetical protein